MPIIGINECGKTTVLNAIFAFDEVNDSWNKGAHLNGIHNLYTTEVEDAIIESTIEISEDELLDVIKSIEKDKDIAPEKKKGIKGLKQDIKGLSEPLVIQRNLETKKYSISNEFFEKRKSLSPLVAEEIVRNCPYILYFDDFNEAVEDKMKIEIGDDGNVDSWLSIMYQLFKKAEGGHSIFDLKKMEKKRRKSVISDAEELLNDSLTKEWSKFSLEGGNAVHVSIDYDTEEHKASEGVAGTTTEYLSLGIIEKLGEKNRFFGIRDRSKGFFWFFNFVMKLEFNPKVRHSSDKDTIYLLDEPGSYLHANAQSKLCEKLKKLSKDNIVIYCTHSHYLLNPDSVPISSVKVVEKDDSGIHMKPIGETSANLKEKRGAFQPLIDALEIPLFAADYAQNNIVLTEGIYDYYVFNLYKQFGPRGTSKLNYYPCVNAQSIAFNISLMIFGGKKYAALWDDDEEGRGEKEKAEKYFGEVEAKKFMVLPALKKRKSYILQDVFDGKDLKMIRDELVLPAHSSFEKTILNLYYAPTDKQKKILKKTSKVTSERLKLIYVEFINRMKSK